MFSDSRLLRLTTVLCCFSLILAVAFAQVAAADTYYVPDDFATIQSAFDAAANGDTILVRPGTYVENLRLREKAITLKSVEDRKSVV